MTPFGIRHSASGIRQLAFGLVVVASVASCGKKGPPLAPLRIAPPALTDTTARRFGDVVHVRFGLPEGRSDTPDAAVRRVEVFAVSVPGASDAPDVATLTREGTRVGTIEVPAPAGAEAPEQAPAPPAFSETLDAAAMKMWEPKRPRPAAATPAVTAAEPAPEPQPMRIYALVPVNARGRAGTAVTVSVPLADPPPAPPAPAIAYSGKGVSLAWLVVEGASGYNVYETAPAAGATAAPGAPLNPSPVQEPAFEDPRLEFGRQRCYSVTSVRAVAGTTLESRLSPPACATPVDTFGPAAPTGLGAVAGPGTISLIWDAVPADDLAGYLVLRGEAPGDTLQALTPEPIKDTTFTDAAVQPGARYVYVVVAVDRAGNMGPQSARVEETARE